MGKRQKTLIQSIFKGEEDVFIIEKLTRDVIERCKLPKTTELRKN